MSGPHRDLGRSSRTWLRFALVLLAVALAIVTVDAVLPSPVTAPQYRVGLGLAAIGVILALLALQRHQRDLSASLRIADALQASERQFAGILEIAADAIISVDDQQKIVHFNRGAEEIFGWTAAEVTGKPLSLLLPERFHAAHTRHIEHFRGAHEVARRMGERREIYGIRKDESEFPAEASISRLELGDRRLFNVVLRDITDRKRASEDERFLSRAGALLGATLDYESSLTSVAHVAVPYLADCCVLDVPEQGGGFRRIVSVHEDAELTKRLRLLEARPLTSGHWPFPVTEAIAREAPVARNGLGPDWAAEGSPRPEQEELVHSLGILALLTVPLSAHGRLLGALTMLATDPGREYGADRRALAHSLAGLAGFALDNATLYQTAQRATIARDEILEVVSHDLRNPLSAISMCARVLLDSPPEDKDAGNELLSAVLESASLMNRLIQDLLDVSVIESGHLTIYRRPELIEPLVDQVLGMLGGSAEERGVNLKAALDEALPHVSVDSTRFVQVLANLVGNGIKFTERGGSVTIGAQHADAEVLFAVRDSGAGVPAEHLPRIFDRYWHARRHSHTAGTGLGLAIARGIVDAHAGRIWAESQEGQGSTFYFTVPAVSVKEHSLKESDVSKAS